MTDADDRERSEWGKLNEGQRYGILAVDVDRALSRADLGKHEQALMQYVRERSWGTATSRKGGKGNAWPEAIEVRWRLAEIAEETGIEDTRLCNAKDSLLKAKMLIEERGCIRINKNADMWVWPARPASGGRPARPETPRLDATAMRYALAGRTRRENIDGGEFVTPERNASNNVVTTNGKKVTPERKNLTENGKKVTPERNPPYKERTSEDFKTLDLKTNTQSVGGFVSDSISIPEAIGIDDPRHPANADDLNPAKPFLHDGPTMPENFTELSRKAVELFRGKRTSFPGLLAGMRSDAVWIDLFREIPADVWHDALRSLAAVKDATKWTPGYFLAIVKRQWREIQEKRRAGVQDAAPAAPKPRPEPEYHVASESFKARRAAFEERRRRQWEEMGVSA